MRELSPVQTAGIEGYYSKEDMVLQMIFYSDITSWRTARLMQVAEECRGDMRSVLVLTENCEVEHLAKVGFLVYRPSLHGLDAEADAMAVIARLRDGDSVVVNTTETELHPKNLLMRHLMNGLAGMNISQLALVVENTEAFFPRKRSYGDNEGMHTMGNLLRRAKTARAPFVFGAESPQEIAREIAKSCGTPIVGRITNDECMRDVSRAVDVRIRKYADAPFYGTKALDPRDFYIYNRYTAPRQEAPQMELGIDVGIHALTRGHLVPCWLSDRVLTCGFLPDAPTPGPDLDGKEQKRFDEEIRQSRIDGDVGSQAPASTPVTPATPATDALPSNVVPMRTKRQAATTTKVAKARSSRIATSEAMVMVEAAGILNAERYVGIGRTVVNARGGRLYPPLDRRLTPRSLAQRVISDDRLREAILAGYALCSRFTRSGAVASSRAYATAYYQAMQEDLALARSFHAEIAVDGIRSAGRRSPRALDLETGLRRLGGIDDVVERGEAQYQAIRSAWTAYLSANARAMEMAA